MRIFQSEECIRFGEPMPVPLGRHPKEACFVMGRTRSGFGFSVGWRRVPGAIGYHVFRSMSIATIRERSMEAFWHGRYAKEVRHFALAYPDVGRVIDDYGSRGAAIMYYWVLAQLAGGHLAPVQGLTVGMADVQVLDGPHFLLAPGGGFVEGAEQAAAAHSLPRETRDATEPEASGERKAEAPPAPRRRERAVEFSRYIAPGGFVFVGMPEQVEHVSVYIGAERPDAGDRASMWQDQVWDTNPMEQFRLPPHYTGFRDDLHPPGSVAHAAAFAFTKNRRVKQLDLALSHDIERIAVLR